MEEKLSTILDDLEGIINQVRTLQEEVSNLKSKMQNARVEECKAREVQYEQMVRKEQYAKLEENYNSMLQDLQEAQAALDTARHEAIESVPKEELGDAKMKVNELQKILSELQAKADDQIATSGELTPRPAWGDLLPSTGHDYSEKHTAELLVDICKHNVYLTHNISQLHEDCSIAQASVFEVPLKKGLPKNRGMDDVSESKGTPRSEAKRIINENKKSQEASRSSTKSKKK
ncbi:hypothetical protein KP509_25G075500 [Ceratopteris richardii]|nr:hypothetical protein KP509_25G075500 [Ceratopteris richardii]